MWRIMFCERNNGHINRGRKGKEFIRWGGKNGTGSSEWWKEDCQNEMQECVK
jgi:hypothetical protein